MPLTQTVETSYVCLEIMYIQIERINYTHFDCVGAVN